MPIALIIGALAAIASAAITAGVSGAQDAERIRLQKEQLARMAGISLPALEKIAATHLPPSHVAALQADQGLKQNQLENIAALQDIASHGGLDLTDQATQENALNKSETAIRQERAGLQQQLAARGQLNSGALIEMAQNAGQENANMMHQAGVETAGNAQRRRMDALKEVAQESGALRNQDFGEAQTKASAADEVARWNASADEKAKYFNQQLAQQDFNNRAALAAGSGAPTNALAGVYGDIANTTRATGAGITGAVGALGQGGQAGINSSGGYGDGNYQQPNPNEWSNPYDTSMYGPSGPPPPPSQGTGALTSQSTRNNPGTSRHKLDPNEYEDVLKGQFW